MFATVVQAGDFRTPARLYIEEANANGGVDNVTVILTQYRPQ